MPRSKRPPVGAGQRFGRLVVLSLDPERAAGRRRFLCRCDCGAEIIRVGASLLAGQATSCGCARVRHGHARGGLGSRTFKSWDAMLYRCTNPSSKDWQFYGGRGITVCDEWRVFANFLRDMGDRPAGMTLDRIDPDGPYCKSNCRWATAAEQGRNKRNVIPDVTRRAIKAAVEQGESQASVARRFAVHQSTVSRVVRGRATVTTGREGGPQNA